jgi:hypothetical protein
LILFGAICEKYVIQWQLTDNECLTAYGKGGICVKNDEENIEKGKHYRKLMIICMLAGIALWAAGMVILNFRRTFLGVLCFCIGFAVLCAGCVFESKAHKYPEPEEPDSSPHELSKEQLEALKQGKPAYDFSAPVMKKKINVMGATFIGVGLFMAVSCLMLWWAVRNYSMSSMMAGLYSGVLLLGLTCVLIGVLLFTLKKHPQRAAYMKVIVLVFCIAAGLFLFIITDYSGSVIFTDILQAAVVFFAMDAIISQGRIY